MGNNKEREIIIKKATRRNPFSLVYEQNGVERFSNNLVKLKKYSVQIRTELLALLYKNFFYSGDAIGEAKLKMFELYYERFMKGNEKDENKYAGYLNNCTDDIYFYHVMHLFGCLKQLKEQGMDFEKLDNDTKEFINLTKSLKKDCGIDANFNPERFYDCDSIAYFNNEPDLIYSNNQLRKDISRKIKYYLRDIEKLVENNKEKAL